MTRCDFNRREFNSALLTVSITCIAGIPAASAQNIIIPPCCPGKCCPALMTVPFAPGGSTDVIARTLADAMSKLKGETVIVENRAGAGGSIGAASVAQGSKDGSKALFATSGVLATTSLLTKPPLRFETDLVPVLQIATIPQVLLVPSSSNINDVLDLVRIARSDRKISFATAGAGSISHFAAEQFSQATGIAAQHVPYKGQAPALIDLAAGQVGFGFFDPASAAAAVKQGGVKALAVTGSSRVPALPLVPSMRERNLAAVDIESWIGILLPIGTPDGSVAAWTTMVERALGEKRVQEIIEQQGARRQTVRGNEFRSVLSRQRSTFENVALARGIKLE